MKKLFIAVAAAATLVTPQAFAQAKNFEGLSIAAGLNVNNNKAEALNTVDRTETNLGAIAQYDIALSESYVLGLGLSLGLSDFAIDTDTKLKNTLSVFVAPGVVINKDTLVYGKIASVSATVDTSGTTSDISGLGYGVGAKYFSSKNVFFQAEYMFNKYDEKKVSGVTFKNQTGVLTLGMGYKF